MDFLKGIFGESKLNFDEFVQAVNAYNGDEANKDKQIKVGNLGSGEYVGKGKYDALQALFDGQKTELDTANGLIAELKKGTKGNEELQGKISGYEAQVADLQKQLNDTKINSALKVAFLEAKALDIDYLTYKVNEKLKAEGKTLELDENEKIKGWDDLLSGLKVQLPTHFEAAGGGRKVLDGGKLPDGDTDPVSVTREQFAKMGYNDRLKLKQENEQLFRQLTSTN